MLRLPDLMYYLAHSQLGQAALKNTDKRVTLDFNHRMKINGLVHLRRKILWDANVKNTGDKHGYGMWSI